MWWHLKLRDMLSVTNNVILDSTTHWFFLYYINLSILLIKAWMLYYSNIVKIKSIQQHKRIKSTNQKKNQRIEMQNDKNKTIGTQQTKSQN